MYIRIKWKKNGKNKTGLKLVFRLQGGVHYFWVKNTITNQILNTLLRKVFKGWTIIAIEIKASREVGNLTEIKKSTHPCMLDIHIPATKHTALFKSETLKISLNLTNLIFPWVGHRGHTQLLYFCCNRKDCWIIWCQRICLSVYLSVTNFDPNYIRIGRIVLSKYPD